MSQEHLWQALTSSIQPFLQSSASASTSNSVANSVSSSQANTVNNTPKRLQANTVNNTPKRDNRVRKPDDVPPYKKNVNLDTGPYDAGIGWPVYSRGRHHTSDKQLNKQLDQNGKKGREDEENAREIMRILEKEDDKRMGRSKDKYASKVKSGGETKAGDVGSIAVGDLVERNGLVNRKCSNEDISLDLLKRLDVPTDTFSGEVLKVDLLVGMLPRRSGIQVVGSYSAHVNFDQESVTFIRNGGVMVVTGSEIDAVELKLRSISEVDKAVCPIYLRFLLFGMNWNSIDERSVRVTSEECMDTVCSVFVVKLKNKETISINCGTVGEDGFYKAQFMAKWLMRIQKNSITAMKERFDSSFRQAALCLEAFMGSCYT